MSLINKLLKGKQDSAGTPDTGETEQQASRAASDKAAGCTTTEESARLYAFAKEHASEQNTAAIFRTAGKESYYLDSRKEQVFPERLMEYGFENPMELEVLLSKVWEDGSKYRELIPVVKVAVFKNRDKYDNRFKDLSLYNYTL